MLMDVRESPEWENIRNLVLKVMKMDGASDDELDTMRRLLTTYRILELVKCTDQKEKTN